MSFECPSCKAETNKLVIYEHPKKLGCPACGVPKSRQGLAGLGQTAQYYTKKDGSQGKITTGKKWELEHRRLTPEGQVINSKTGKDAQY